MSEDAGGTAEIGLDDASEVSSLDIPPRDTTLGKVIYAIGFVTAAIAVYFLSYRPIPQVRYANLHLGLMLLLFFVLEFHGSGLRLEWSRRRALEIGAFGLAIAAGLVGIVFIHFQYDRLAFSAFGRFTEPEYAAAVVIVLAVIYATKRAFGWIISGVVVATLLFARFGPAFPGLLRHGGFDWFQILEFTVLEFTGVYHMLFQIGATWIFIFLIWAGLIQEHGFLDTLFDIGFLIGAKFRSGVAQSAVVTSMFMGGISGSPLANIAVTGSFTIPLMKERGISGQLAAGIESVASTGGLILPPIMGSVAFIMANFLGLAYGDIIVAATLPALLFYIAVGLSVHLSVVNLDLDVGIEREVDYRSILQESLPVVASLVVLVYLLVWLRLSPGISGVYAIGALLAGELVKRLALTRGDTPVLEEGTDFVLSTGRGLVNGSVRMAPLSVILSGMGIVITSFNTTGTGHRISLEIVKLAGGSVLLLLFMVMISSIVLGMGMPSVAAYLITVTLIAPAMVAFGFEQLTAHFFVFYFAIIATITPPIALGPAVACQIAESDFLGTCVESLKIGFPLFLIPYVFAFNQRLIVVDGLDSIAAFGTTLAGLLILVAALHSNVRFSGRYTGAGIRAVSVLVGFVVIFHAQLINVVSL